MTAMMRIAHERLIEIAEGSAPPTAGEQHLLDEDAALRAELAELRELFADLRVVPEEFLEPRALAGILPGLRQQIEEHERRRAPLAAWFPRPAWNAAFATLSMALVIGLLMVNSGDIMADLPVEYFAVDNSSQTEYLQLEASVFADLELEVAADLDQAEIAAYVDDSTTELMTEAASIDNDAFRRIAENLAQEGKK